MKTKNRIYPILFYVILFLALSVTLAEAQVQPAKAKIKEKAESTEKQPRTFDPVPGGKYTESELIRGDFETVIKLLTNYKEQAQWKKDLAKSAYDVFSMNKNAGFADLIANKTFRRICDSLDMQLLGGPMLGQVSETGVSVWVRTFGAASVTIQVKGKGVFGPVETTSENDFAAEVKISGLKPDKSYAYTVCLDGKPVPGKDGSLKTADPKNTRIVFGTCPHRWGLANPKLWNTVLSRKADALLAYGDVAVQDRGFDVAMHRFDYFVRDLHTPWQSLEANLPVYVSWDDHDYYSNDHWGLGLSIGQINETPPGVDADRLGIRHIFQTSWNNPAYGFENEKGGVFFRTRIGAADVIMTDNRYFRGVEGPFLGEGQMKWLEEQLLECKGPFIIVTCGTLWTDYKANGKDSWGVFDPEGRERILNFIEEHHIPGVLLLSGDWHGARAFIIPRPSGYSFYEFQPASLGGRGKHRNMDVQEEKMQKLQDNWLSSTGGRNAFGEFTFNTRKKDPTVTYRLMLDDGTEYYKITLTRSMLVP